MQLKKQLEAFLVQFMEENDIERIELEAVKSDNGYDFGIRGYQEVDLCDECQCDKSDSESVDTIEIEDNKGNIMQFRSLIQPN